MPLQLPTKESVSPMGVTLPQAPPTMIDFIPLKLVLTLASPYLAGHSGEEAIEIGHRLHREHDFASTLDILGEDAQTDEDCEASVAHYMRLVDAIKAHPLECENRRQQLTISMKPSMFSTMAPQHGADSDRAQEAAFDRITRVVDYALKNEINVTLEAEDHRWTNFQLESYFALINAGYANLGTVLQTRLFRTEKDIARFDGRMRVRLVIGIYNEPGQIAHTDKRIMKDLLVQYGSNLLARGVYTELASHDTRCIETFYKKVVLPQSVPASQFEHQFLQGVPRTKLQNGLVTGNYFREPEHGFAASAHLEKLKETGALVRMYLPFGTAKVSGAYCKRRLRENPNMITYGVKNLLGLQ